MHAMSSSPVSPRRALLPDEIRYPEDLPITAWREELLAAVRDHQVVIVAGETGSGKSTQLPKMCLELGRGIAGRIGHTQPRRIAARSIAERVASELGTHVGGLVGYTVRFTDEVDEGTAIKVMTDGILLNELQRDRDLRAYDTIIIDEAHERSLNIDFLLGYLKGLLPRRPDLRVIITSATIDTERFADHFAGAPIIEVEGRTYPVEVRYRPIDDPGESDQTSAVCDAVSELAHEGTGDILVFCSGEREIRDVVDALAELDLRHTEILPLFGRLSAAQQHRVFSSHTGRRIVVATNVAETSLTVPGIRYVVDTGFARVSRYSKRTKVQQLPIEPVSQASADQRAGRCGRLGPGIAIRLYSEEDYRSRPEFTEPEILRTNLAAVMLQMASIGLGPMEDFPFIDGPDTRTIKDGISVLHELGAIDDGPIGTRRWLTDVGRTLARLPVDPRLGRMLIAADHGACLDEVLTIASALAIQDPRERPIGKEAAADQSHARFRDESSDFLGWLRLWDYISSQRDRRTSNRFRRMCRQEFLHWRRIREWQDLRAQLRRVTRDLGMHPNRRPAGPDIVHEAVLTGLLSHVGRKDPDSFLYRGARGTTFAIRPGSVLFKRAPEWVMAAELVETTRTWATGVAAVDPTVVERVGNHLVRTSVSDPWWDRSRGAAVCRVTTSLYGLTLSSDRIMLYDRVDPAVARDLFVRNALVEGDWDTLHDFARHNAQEIDAVLEIETRERRADLLVTDDVLHAWFSARIPPDVTSAAAFDAWWKDERHRRPDLLYLTESDVVDPAADRADGAAFPRVWSYGDLEFDLTYAFDPGSDDDGVTVDIPWEALDLVDPTAFTANVPGLRLELVTSMIRSLPKRLRRLFAPAPDTAAEVLPALTDATEPLDQALARLLTQRSGTIIRPDDFDRDRLPPHVVPRFRIIDDSGEVIAAGVDLDAMRDELRTSAREAVSGATHEIERSGVTEWDFGDLPDSVTVGEGRHAIEAYPAVIDDGDSVSIRLFATPAERDVASWAGIRRLVLLALPSPRRLLRSVVDAEGPISVVGSPYPTVDAWMDDVLVCAVDAGMERHGGLVRTRGGFDALVAGVRDDLATSIDRVGSRGAALLAALHELSLAIGRTPEHAFGDVVDDIDQQLDRIVFDGCLAAVGMDRVDDLRRYVDAATYRLERVAEDPVRDRGHMATVNALEAELDELTEVLTVTPELVEVAWMIQELRVSLFAQPIGARGPVSDKRVRAALEGLLR
jgi:ATP-dependent helicase HrpA